LEKNYVTEDLTNENPKSTSEVGDWIEKYIKIN